MPVIRIDKFISQSAGVSRSEARLMLKQGRVTIDGRIVSNADCKADTEADIRLDGLSLSYKKYRYFMMNKPAGYLSATEDNKDKTVFDLLPEDFKKLNLFCAGRLDKDSEGLLLLTNDGDFCHKIISPKSNIVKEYYVKMTKELCEEAEKHFASGLRLGDGTQCLPAKLTILPGGLEAVIAISEGKYHQVKRMVWACGSEVIYLKRLAIGGLRLDEGLRTGEIRELSTNDFSNIYC
jgi:16S rRNA pseudouridine516 synthase